MVLKRIWIFISWGHEQKTILSTETKDKTYLRGLWIQRCLKLCGRTWLILRESIKSRYPCWGHRQVSSPPSPGPTTPWGLEGASDFDREDHWGWQFPGSLGHVSVRPAPSGVLKPSFSQQKAGFGGANSVTNKNPEVTLVQSHLKEQKALSEHVSNPSKVVSDPQKHVF